MADMETVSVIWVEGIGSVWVCPFFCGRTEAWTRGSVSCAMALAAVSAAIWLMGAGPFFGFPDSN